jgi:hypothetical protein
MVGLYRGIKTALKILQAKFIGAVLIPLIRTKLKCAENLAVRFKKNCRALIPAAFIASNLLF